jgi:Ras-related protein Rab-1A
MTLSVDGKTVRLQIWDTAGQERYRSLTPAYYKSAHGIIFVYDVTDRTSFTHVEKWMKDTRHHAHTNLSLLLVGKKIDLPRPRQVSQQTVQAYGDDHRIAHIETSAETGMNIDAAFITITKQLMAIKSVTQVPTAAADHENSHSTGCLSSVVCIDWLCVCSRC